MTIEFRSELKRDGETYSVRYECVCGCKPQVKLQRGSPPTHEHCCCGIAHAAGPDARAHLEQYLATRHAEGKDADRTYAIADAAVTDPWGEPVSVAYAIPSVKETIVADGHGVAGGATNDKEEVTTMAMILDPICDMIVDVEQQRQKGLTSELTGKTYAFCSGGCKKTFDKDPGKFTAKVSAWEASAAPGQGEHGSHGH